MEQSPDPNDRHRRRRVYVTAAVLGAVAFGLYLTFIGMQML
ncbi:hypothetical protein J2T57_002359 [Natronocella acetinitrilica]|uniref:Uncharacterized protein n=1 Tax=Natronocella acetinitrilica TaxID=414046 RepID=A0AAE3G3N6_9GAMM|nr:hypothetical protein [Natronocella acetinitrilica]MCP1675211.1 hypothetical protein [Natronocella acetinitrilica]